MLFRKKQNQSSEKPTGKKTKEERQAEALRAERLKKQALRPSIANTIGYDALFENGLMQIGEDYFSQTYALGDVNYQTVENDEKAMIIEKYSSMINSLEDGTTFQLTLHNQPVNIEKFKASVFYKKQEDELDVYRGELNEMMKRNFDSGENNFRTYKYVTFGKKAQSAKLANRSLNQIGQYFKQNFANIDASFDQLTGTERVDMMKAIFAGENRRSFNFEVLDLTGLTTKDFIAPNVISFREKDYIEVGEGLLQILYVKEYSTEIGDTFIRDLMQSDKELVISLTAEAVNKSEKLKKFSTKRALMEGQKASDQQKLAQKGVFVDSASPVIDENIRESTELMDMMKQTGERVFNTIFLIGVYANDKDELKENIDIVKQIASSNDLIVSNLRYMQEAALNSLLPIGRNTLGGVTRSLLTSNIAVNSPFTSVDLQDKGGKFYGINQLSSNIISVSRESLNTPSGLILGTSGSGKGMSTKAEIISTILKQQEKTEKSEVIIVDPEDEYSIIGQVFKGEQINISPDSTTYINVLDLSNNQDEDPVKIKSEFLLSWISKLLGRSLSGREKSIIDRVTRLTYDNFDKPTLVDWTEVLRLQPELEAEHLTLDLELYVQGSLDIFSHQTNIKTDNSILVYNVKKLGDEMKQIALMVVFDQIWNRLVDNQKKGISTWIYFDEMQLLLLDKFASDFFFRLWSRVRKYGGIPTGITQNVETLLQDANGQRIIANSEFMILLKQAKLDRESLVHLLGLSEELEQFLVNPDKGAGLIKAGSVVVPFTNKIPNNTELYRIMSTDPKDMVTEAWT